MTIHFVNEDDLKSIGIYNYVTTTDAIVEVLDKDGNVDYSPCMTRWFTSLEVLKEEIITRGYNTLILKVQPDQNDGHSNIILMARYTWMFRGDDCLATLWKNFLKKKATDVAH
jgi:hypothetical protein